MHLAVLSLLRILGNSLQLRLVHGVELPAWDQRKPIKEHPDKNIPASVLFGLCKKSQCRGLLQKCTISVQVSAAPQMQIDSHMGLGYGLCGVVSRNSGSLSGPQGLPRLQSLPAQSIRNNPKINRNCPLPHCKLDHYERKKFYFSKLGTESICFREEADN